LAFGFGDVFAANDNFARPTPLLPCLRGSCHEVTEGATSQPIIQLITCPRNHEGLQLVKNDENVTGKARFNKGENGRVGNRRDCNYEWDHKLPLDNGAKCLMGLGQCTKP